MPRLYELLAVLVALGAFGGYMYYKGGVTPRAERDAVQARLDAFTKQVKVMGEAAQKASDAEKAKDIADKEQADHENASIHAADNATIVKLRHDLAARTSGNYLPAPQTGSVSPNLACFDRQSLEFAVRDFVSDIRGQVDQGTAATIDLNTAKAWAQWPSSH